MLSSALSREVAVNVVCAILVLAVLAPLVYVGDQMDRVSGPAFTRQPELA
jgi:hypothetical protein